MDTRAWFQLFGPFLTLLGVCLSVWGTFVLTKPYHPLKAFGFLISVLRISFLYMCGKRFDAEEEVSLLEAFAINSEVKKDSLIGICIIFLGFVAQAFGAVFWGVDSVWGVIQNMSGKH